MKYNFRGSAAILGVAIALMIMLQPRTAGALVSAVWKANAPTTDWFTATNWISAVPKDPGDIVRVAGSTATINWPQLTADASAGQVIFGLTGPAKIQGTFSLTMDNPGDSVALIQTVPGGAPGVSAIISSPLKIAAGEDLRIDTALNTSLTLSGGLTSPTGNISKTGAGPLTISASAAAWDGKFTLEAGNLFVTHADALGSAVRHTAVRAAGILNLQTTTSEPIDLQGGTVQLYDSQANNPIDVPVSGLIRNSNSVVELAGPITGAGVVTFQNSPNTSSGRALRVSGNNSYSGQTYVAGAWLTANSATAFGDAASGTTIRENGTLELNAVTDELFRVEAGTFRLAAGGLAYQRPVTLVGGTMYIPTNQISAVPVIVTAASGTVTGDYVTSSWVGGSSGTGSLTINGGVNVDAPLGHNGDLILDRAQLNTANHHTGDTIIIGTATVNHPQAFGTAQTPIRVQSGELILNAIPDGRDFKIEYGWLNVQTAAQPVTNTIVLGTESESAIRGHGIFTGEIRLAPKENYRNFIAGGTFNGLITGHGEVHFGGTDAEPTNLNAANNVDGPHVVDGITNLNHPQGLLLPGTRVVAGRLNINVPISDSVVVSRDFSNVGTVAFQVPQQFAVPWMVSAGTIEAATDVTMSRLILAGADQIATATSSGSGNLRINNELLVIGSGAITGKLSGAGDVNLVGNRLGIDADLSGFSGKINVDHGVLEMNNAATLGAGEIHVRNQGQLYLFDGHVIEKDIFLHNADGPSVGYAAALVFGQNGIQPGVFRGRIDVGDQGSTLLAANSTFAIEGQLTGRNARLKGGSFSIRSPQQDLHGSLRLDRADLSLDDNGRLSSMDEVLLEKSSQLNISRVNSGPQDRIDDALSIRSRGGVITNSGFSTNLSITTETLGTLLLERGYTKLEAYFDSPRPTPTLLIKAIDRQPGAVLRFSLHSDAGGIGLVNPPPLQNGMIGAWATTDNGFATLDANNAFATLAATSTNLASSLPADHVLVDGPQSISADHTIASFHGNDGTQTNLQGHRLTITSGGIFRSGEIFSGQLTAGSSAGAELVVHQSNGRIGASIVDNPGGSVGLVVNSSALHLSGNNTYTGGTWVAGTFDAATSSPSGSLIIENAAAVPANDRVFIDGGIYDLRSLFGSVNSTVQLAELHLRGGGVVQGYVETPINARNVFLEDGQFNATLMGNGAVFKDTDGTVNLSDSPNFTGTVIVREGGLLIGGNTMPLASFVVLGGQVQSSAAQINNDFVLQGGALGPTGYRGHIDVQSSSIIDHAYSATNINGRLTGNGPLTIRGELDTDFYSQSANFFGDATQYAGDITVESGTLRFVATSKPGSGEISVMPGARLALGNRSSSTLPVTLGNTIHLRGGTLVSTPPGSVPDNSQPAILSGHVIVDGEAFIGGPYVAMNNLLAPGLVFTGSLSLADGAQVYGTEVRYYPPSLSTATVEVAGELLAGAGTTWNLLTSSVAITGTIRSNAAQASINFVCSPSLLHLDSAALEVGSGQSLAVLINGQSQPLALTGAGNVLQGNGSLIGDISVANGAAVAPGASPGLLSVVGNAQFHDNGALAIELGGLLRGVKYDGLDVSGNVFLNGALLQISLIDGFTPRPSDGFIVLRATHISGTFKNAPTFIDVGGNRLPVTYRDDMVILGNPLAVPEPTMGMQLIICAISLILTQRRSGIHRRCVQY